MKSVDLYDKENCVSLEISKSVIFPNFSSSPKIIQESSLNNINYLMTNSLANNKSIIQKKKRNYSEYVEAYKDLISDSENSNSLYKNLSKRIKHWHIEEKKCESLIKSDIEMI